MSVYVETNKMNEFRYGYMNPHYSDDRFYNSQTVFLIGGYTTTPDDEYEYVQGISYEYSDRLRGMYGSQSDQAHKEVLAKGTNKKTPVFHEAYLQELFQDSGLILVHIVVMVNRSTGQPYYVYGYISTKSE